jgi:hypothetical protein
LIGLDAQPASNKALKKKRKRFVVRFKFVFLIKTYPKNNIAEIKHSLSLASAILYFACTLVKRGAEVAIQVPTR